MKKIVLLLLTSFLSVLVYSCGEEDTLTAADVEGTWFTENTRITENSCNLSDSFFDKMKERDYYLFEADGDNLKMYACKTASCSEKGIIGTYTFKSTININIDDETYDFNEKGYDCKLTFKTSKDAIIFESSDSGKQDVEFTIAKSGSECTKLRAKFEEALKSAEDDKKDSIEDLIKLLGDNSCNIGINADIKKQ